MKSIISFLILSILALSFASQVHAVSFKGLGDLPGGIFSSGATGISADGSVVVGLGVSASGVEAFRWTQSGGMVGLGDLPGGNFVSWSYDVSADGSVVVGWGATVTGEEAFRWTQSSGMIGLGGIRSEARGVSADGSVVVGYSYVTDLEAFRWTQSNGLINLGDLPGGDFYSQAHGVSADGSVVVGWGISEFGEEAFRWTLSGGMVGLGDLPGGGVSSQAKGVSADGSILFGSSWSSIGWEVFRWTEDSGMVGLGILPGGYGGSVFDVSADGSVVVGDVNVYNSVTPSEAFIWDEINGMHYLIDLLIALNLGEDLDGWILYRASGVSADGKTIVGHGFNPDWDGEAWIADLHLTIDEIIDFIIEHDDIVGVGKGKTADNKYNGLLNMLQTIGDLIDAGDNEGACDLLNDIIKKCDGERKPKDFITGDPETMEQLFFFD